MPLELVTLRCLKDNYAYLLHGDEGTVLIDAPESGPILRELAARGWSLSAILLTHHHGDHVDGVADIVRETGALVIGGVILASRAAARSFRRTDMIAEAPSGFPRSRGAPAPEAVPC